MTAHDSFHGGIGSVFAVIGYWIAQLINFLPPVKETTHAIVTSILCAISGFIAIEVLKWLMRFLFIRNKEDNK